MYRGFNLKLIWDVNYYDQFTENGKKIFESNLKIVKNTLNNFALDDGKLDGSKMQQNWFPKVHADIFISHSHKDRDMAIALAGWLKFTFGIDVFIDSCIWGYSDDLLKIIDKKYCYKTKTNTYDYNLRNHSTSHVHMMLSTALTMMIDNSECLFFLNTPNSISMANIVSKTESPWIYNEIAMTKLLRQKSPSRIQAQESYVSEGSAINEQLNIQYDLDLSHLTDINTDTLNLWSSNYLKKDAYTAEVNRSLDELYLLKPINKNLSNDYR